MFDLFNYLPYLINRAGVRVATMFTQEVKPFDVTVQEWRVLAALSFNGPQRMSGLADLTSIDRTTLSRLVTRMEQGGFVTRSRVEEDGREVHIGLSKKGAKTADGITPVAVRYEEIALDGFTDEEAKALKEMLKRVYGNFDKL
jgi:MarR family transcriptional regulator, organic hydroperoxide resistance regulator